LQASGLDRLIPALTQPVLGICLGMQLLFAGSDEGNVACLALLHGQATRFPTGGLPVPHMGWNELRLRQPHALLAGLKDGDYAYFVHSYALPVSADTLATADYGGEFTAVAARGNFCTLDAAGKISDRRAGRIPSEESFAVVEKLQAVKIPGVETFVKPVKEHRFVVVFRGKGLDGRVADTDPQAVGVAPLDPQAVDPAAAKTAEVAKEFVKQARAILKGEPKANGLVLRGFAAKPALPTYEQLYGLKAAAIAVYPMYKGLAQLVGMTLVGKAQSLDEQIAELAKCWNDYDFFFMHFKYTDSTGEDGAFDQKVKRIEELDRAIPKIEALKPDVLIVTGDHSTPSKLKSHSWHPVPTLLVAAVVARTAGSAKVLAVSGPTSPAIE
jgi:2,3-diphosphopglycerate-independent phosphoglycerate mutase